MTPTKATRKKNTASANRVWDILTLLVLFVTLLACGLFAFIFANPYAALNPFPPATPRPRVIIPTVTWTPLQPEATWTPTPTIPPTATNTPRPTITVPPTNTPFIPTAEPTNTPINTPSNPSPTPRPTGVPYAVTILALESTIYRPETDCNWFGVAGQALDANNGPMQGLIVRMGGSLPGKTIYPEQTVLTGLASAYGPSGFEFVLGIPPVTSKNSLWVQLFDQTGQALSDQIYLTTSKECDKNLIFVRFKQK